MTVRGGGVPIAPLGFHAGKKNGSAASELRRRCAQKDSALAHWSYARTKNAPQTRKTMIVALARKLLIALWQLVREGAIPEGVVLRPAV